MPEVSRYLFVTGALPFIFGLVVVLIGRGPASFEAQASVFLPFSVLVSSAYLVLGVRYWFRTPIIAISLAVVCFLTSWLVFAAQDEVGASASSSIPLRASRSRVAVRPRP